MTAKKVAANKAAKKSPRKAVAKRPPGRPSIWTAKLENCVIAAIADTGSQTEAAKRCGIHRQRIDERELADEGFRSRIARAREIGYAARAEQAVLDAKSAEDATKGRLAFDAERWWLSKIAPRQFGDKVSLEHAGPNGGAIPVSHVDAGKLSDATLQELLNARRAATDGG